MLIAIYWNVLRLLTRDLDGPSLWRDAVPSLAVALQLSLLPK